MKYLLLIALALTTIACDDASEVPAEVASALDASRADWAHMRASADGHYWYRSDRFGASAWSSSTWVEVRDGEVVRVERAVFDEAGNPQDAASDFGAGRFVR